MAKKKTAKKSDSKKKQTAPAKKPGGAKKVTAKAAKVAKKAAKAARRDAAAAAVIAASDEARYNWEDVTERIGAPSNDDVALFAVRDSPSALLDRGRRIGSGKILTDLLRWLGQIADDVARGGPSTSLPGFGLGSLRVIASDGLRLRNVVDTSESASGAQSALDASHATDAGTQFELALKRRDALRAALRTAAENDAGRQQVDVATGTAKTPRTLKNGIDALVKLGRGWLERDDNVGKRLAAGNVTIALLDEIGRLGAAQLSAGEKSSGAKTSGAVTQRDLDLQDGTCLVHMEHLLEVFGVGYAANPKVPHLVPIATRSYFSHPRGKDAGAAPGDGGTESDGTVGAGGTTAGAATDPGDISAEEKRIK